MLGKVNKPDINKKATITGIADIDDNCAVDVK